MELFGWDDAAAATESFSFSGTVMKVFNSALTWIKSLFSDPVKALTDLLAGYFGAYLTVGDFILNMIKKPIAWVMGLFGWDEAADEVEAFSLKDTVMKAVTAIGEWFGDMFDKIINFDFKSLAKSIMPDFLADMIFGKAEPKKDKSAETKKLDLSAADTGGLSLGAMFDIGAMMAPIREKVMTLLDPEQAVWGMGKFTGFLRDTLLKLLPEPTKMAEGGLVGMSPFAKGSMGRAMGLETGGLFTLSQGEMVLDNQAAQTFLKAAQLLTGSQVLEQSRMGGGGGAPVIINNNNVDNSMQSSQTTAVSIPAPTRSNESTLRALQAA